MILPVVEKYANDFMWLQWINKYGIDAIFQVMYTLKALLITELFVTNELYRYNSNNKPLCKY